MSTLREALFAPKSVAIVGQSNDFSKTAGRPLKVLKQMRYEGLILVYPANKNRRLLNLLERLKIRYVRVGPIGDPGFTAGRSGGDEIDLAADRGEKLRT